MEENRYSLVAGKSRVERAERERECAETPPVERGRFVCIHTEAHAHSRGFHTRAHTRAYTESRDSLSRFGQDDPGENA